MAKAKEQLNIAFELSNSLAAPLTQLQQQLQAAADDVTQLEARMGSTQGVADLKKIEAAFSQAETGLAAVGVRRSQFMAAKEDISEQRSALREECAFLLSI